jgi:peroxiredoxin
MLRRVLTGFALGIALMFAYLVSPARVPAAVTAANARKPAPDFVLDDSKGATVRMSDYKGKVVLLNFWATWCHGCKLEIPWFIDFQNKYKHSGLAVIGVSMDDDGWKSVKPFLEEKRLNYSVVIGSEDLGKLYGLGSMPMTVLIGRDGRIAASYSGVVDKAKCEREIRTLLHAKAKNAPK